MPSDHRPHVAVIGGGIAGLVAAWELSRAGVAVEVYEREETLGGRIRRRKIAGQQVDVGAESFAVRGAGVADLLADLGLSNLVEQPSIRGSWVVHSAVTAPLPPAGMLGIPAAPWGKDARRILGTAGALRAAIEPLLPRRIGRGAPTVAALIRARLGARVLARLVAPVVRGVYSADPAALPLEAVPGLAEARRTHRSLSAAARAQRQSTAAAGAAVAGLAGGMGTLVDELERQLTQRQVTIHRGVAVRSIRETGAGFVLDAEGGERAPAAAVVVTVPGIGHTSAAGSAAIPVGVPREAESDAAATVEVIALLLDDPRLIAAPRGTGALVAERARQGGRPIRAKALTHSSAKWPWLARELPADRHLIRLSYGESARPGAERTDACTLGLDDTAALALACADAGGILGVPVHPDQVVGMARQSHVMPARAGGRAGLRADAGPADGVFPAGEWVSGTGLATVIPAARTAAQNCLTYLVRTTLLARKDVLS